MPVSVPPTNYGSQPNQNPTYYSQPTAPSYNPNYTPVPQTAPLLSYQVPSAASSQQTATASKTSSGFGCFSCCFMIIVSAIAISALVIACLGFTGLNNYKATFNVQKNYPLVPLGSTVSSGYAASAVSLIRNSQVATGFGFYVSQPSSSLGSSSYGFSADTKTVRLDSTYFVAVRSVAYSSSRAIMITVAKGDSNSPQAYNTYTFTPSTTTVSKVLGVQNLRREFSSNSNYNSYRIMVLFEDSSHNVYSIGMKYTSGSYSLTLDSKETSIPASFTSTSTVVTAHMATLADNIVGFTLTGVYANYGTSYTYVCYVQSSSPNCFKSDSSLTCTSHSIVGLNETAFLTQCDSSMYYWRADVYGRMRSYSQSQSLTTSETYSPTFGPIIRNYGDNSTLVAYFVDNKKNLKAVIANINSNTYGLSINNDKSQIIATNVDYTMPINFVYAEDFLAFFTYGSSGQYYATAVSAMAGQQYEAFHVASDATVTLGSSAPASVMVRSSSTGSTSNKPYIIFVTPLSETQSPYASVVSVEVQGGVSLFGLTYSYCYTYYASTSCNSDVTLQGIISVPTGRNSNYNGFYGGQAYYTRKDGTITSESASLNTFTNQLEQNKFVGIALNANDLLLKM